MKVCKVEGCNNTVDAKGFCQKHYIRYKQGQDPFEKTRRDSNDYAIVDNTIIVKTRGKTSKDVLLDLEKLEVLKDILLENVITGNKRYPAITETAEGKKMNIHLVSIIHGELEEDYVYSYKDENGYNLKKENIEVISTVEFARRNAVRNKKYMTPGLSFNKKSKKWITTISVDNQSKYLGSFDTELEAAQERIRAEKEYWGKVYSEIKME